MMPKHHVENLRCIVYWKIRYSLKGYTPRGIFGKLLS